MTHQDGSDWYDDAACRGLGWTRFFDPEEAAAVRPVCEACPVRVRCLQFAINNAVKVGVWGGLTPLERERSRLPQTWVA